jgi:hypothetical protein
MSASACLQMLRPVGYPLAVRRCGIRRRVGMRVHAQSSELRVLIHQTPTSPRNDGKLPGGEPRSRDGIESRPVIVAATS